MASVMVFKESGAVAGLYNNTAQYAARMIGKGSQFVTIAAESRFMVVKAGEELAVVRKAGAQDGVPPAYETASLRSALGRPPVSAASAFHKIY